MRSSCQTEKVAQVDQSDIFTLLLAIFGLLAAGLVVRVVSKRKTKIAKSYRVVSQKGNVAGRDIIAGDSKKRDEKPE